MATNSAKQAASIDRLDKATACALAANHYLTGDLREPVDTQPPGTTIIGSDIIHRLSIQ
jgi:hypothetical protein